MKNWSFKSVFRVILAVLCASSLAFSRSVVDSLEKNVAENPLPMELAPSHFDVSIRLDVPLVLGIALTSALGVYQYYGMERISAENMKPSSELLMWDRPFAGRYSEWATNVSHYSAVLAVAPFVFAGYSWYKGDVVSRDFWSFSLMLVEAFALQNALNQIVRSSQLWPRPYIYSKHGKGETKAKEARGEAYGSFYSGHASAAWTVAVFMGEWFSEVYPNSRYKTLVWASSFSAAALVGALRVVAGKHYPTDVVVGSLVGAGVSLGIIKIHELCKNKISFWAVPGSLGIVLFI